MGDTPDIDVAKRTHTAPATHLVGYPPFRHVIAFHDGSEHALIALHHAVDIAASFRAKLDVAFIEPSPPDGDSVPDLLGRTGEERLMLKQAMVARITERAGIHADCSLLIGRPSRVGIDFARQLGCDLIVIGAATAHPVHDRLWGSRASRIARDGICSVLVVRTPP